MRPAAASAILLLVVSLSPAGADTSVVDSLQARGKVGIPLERARLLESELGQLFIVNVDGFGYAGPLALEPDFAPLVERLQIGGVIPHYGSTSYERIRRTNRALAGMTGLPLLICSDIVWLRSKKPGRPAATASFGDGYVGGFIGRYRDLPDGEFETLTEVNAFVFAALGVNVALGPTIDDSTRDARTEERARTVTAQLRRFGLESVAKHFPFLPSGANLHRSSPDTRVPPGKAGERIAVFRDLAADFPIMMTTHLNDSLVDNRIVTFSPSWIALLRHETGFKGLLMSDGLLMLKAYPDTAALGGAPGPGEMGLDPTAVWAMHAILAGHDLIIVEGSAAQTIRTFNGLLAAACSGSPEGKALADRIEQSYGRIRRFKLDNDAFLRREVHVPASTVDDIVAMMPREGADLKGFRFDASALRAVEPGISLAARVGPPR